MMTLRVNAMLNRALVIAATSLALAGCDAATQIAGEAVAGEVRGAVDTQCREIAAGAGIVADRVADVCSCSVEAIMADGDVSLADLNPAEVERTVNSCARSTGAAANPAAAGTEEAGG
jgi:hypothetical protein